MLGVDRMEIERVKDGAVERSAEMGKVRENAAVSKAPQPVI